MSLMRKLAGQTAIYGLGHVLGRIIYFLVIASYLTYKFADTKSYGIYTDMYAYATLLIVVFSYRIDTAFFRFGSKDEDLEKAYSSALIPIFLTSVGILILGLLFAKPIANLLSYPEHVHYIRWFMWIIFFDVLMLLPFARMRLEDKAKSFVIYKLINIFLTIILILFFLQTVPWLIQNGFDFFEQCLIFNDQVDYVFFSNLIVSCLLMILMSPHFKKLRWDLVDWGLYRRMLWYAAPLIIVGIANSINQFFAIPLQKYFLGNDIQQNLSEAGVYAGPQRIAMLISIVTTAFNYAAEPFFFKQSSDRKNPEIYGDVAKTFVIALGFVILCLLFYFDIFKHLVDVSKYEEGFVIVPILLFAYLFLGLYYNVSIWYKLADKTIYGAWISVIGAVITLSLSLYFLPKIGFIASAWAALACYVSMVLLALVTGRFHYPISYPIFRILQYIFVMFILYRISVWFSWHRTFEPWFMVFNTGLLLIYVGLVYFLDGAWLKKVFTKA